MAEASFSTGMISPDGDFGMADPAEVAGQQGLSDTASATLQDASGADGSDELSTDEAIDSSALEAALQGEEKPKAEETEPEADPEAEEPKKLTPYQRRVQGLIEDKKQAQAQAAQIQAHFQAQLVQMQAELKAEREANRRTQEDILRRQVAILEEEQRAKEEAKLTDVERAKRRFEADTVAKARAAVDPEIQKALSEVNSIKAELQRAKSQYEQQQRVNQWTGQIRNTIDKQLLTGFDTQDVAKLQPKFEEVLAAFSGAYGAEPEQIAPDLKAFLDDYVRAKLKVISKSGGAKVAQSKAVGTPLPAGRSGAATVQRVPSLQELQAKGYRDHIAWRAQGSRPL